MAMVAGQGSRPPMDLPLPSSIIGVLLDSHPLVQDALCKPERQPIRCVTPLTASICVKS